MDGFPGFHQEEEWSDLEIDPEKLNKIIAKLLTEFNLELKEMSKPVHSQDYIAVSATKFGKEATTIVRVRSYVMGLTHEDVEDLYEDMLDQKAHSAIFITDSHFTKEAREFAENNPVKLIDSVELGELLKEYNIVKAQFAFKTAFPDKEVLSFFYRNRRRKYLNIVGPKERIGEIDRRYVPIGHFIVKKETRDSEVTHNIYIDLTSGSIFYLEENKIEENPFFKKVLDLPEESQIHLLDLIKYGELRHKHIEGKAIDILEKERLVRVEKKANETGILNILLNEITDTISLTTSEATTMSHPEPKEDAFDVKTKKYVHEITNKPQINNAYDLGHFLDSDPNIDPNFEPDPIHYEPEKTAYVLDSIYPNEDIYFVDMAYLPYYRCKFIGEFGTARFQKLFTPKFKGFVPRNGPFSFLYKIIDVAPALPYMIIALAYGWFNLDNPDELLHIGSIATLFSISAIGIGLLFKAIFRTPRKMPRYGNTIVKYGFPSLHALGSAGAVGFTYFIDPRFLSLTVPILLVYIYSRVRLGVHSKADILGGLLTGAMVGLFFGMYGLQIYLPDIVEILLTAGLILGSLFFTLVDTKYR